MSRTEGHSSPRRSSGCSSFDYNLNRRNSHELLANFDLKPSPTMLELCELQVALDNHCLQLAINEDLRPTQYATSIVNSVVGIAVYLSSPLCVARFPGTFLFQEVQFRALISCLALLHYHKVEALHPQQWDRIHTNITELFRTVSFQRGEGMTPTEGIRYAPNVYLVQLVSVYLSFVRRGDSALPSVVGPICKIFFGSLGVASSQYNHVQQILEGLTELSSLWQSPQSKYKALCGLQEYIRLASSLCREYAFRPEPGRTKEATEFIVSALLQKVSELLITESSSNLPTIGRQWPRTRAIIGLPPPDLDRGYYFIGLLDCAAQLATVTSIDVFPDGLLDRVARWVVESSIPEFRWKAIEVLLACHATRREQSIFLKTRVEEECQPVLRETVTNEITGIEEVLDHDEEASLRISVSQPLNKPPDFAHHPRINLTGRRGVSQDTLYSPLTTPDSSDRGTQEDIIQTAFREHAITKSKVKATKTFAIAFIRRGLLSGRPTYDYAGLSEECRYAFFYKTDKITVFELACSETQPISAISPPVPHFYKKFKLEEPIFDVVMTKNYLIVATDQSLRIIDIDNTRELGRIPHGDWEPTRVAYHESQIHLIIALGQGQGSSMQSSAGRIMLYKFTKDRSANLSLTSEANLSTRDRPKRLNLYEKIVTCVTTIQNKLLVWTLDDVVWTSNDGLHPQVEPFEFVKNHYRVERYETGITSTSLYTSPSQHNYILVTTAPSHDRHSNKGEWSFILPLPTIRTPSTPRIRPPNHLIHDFEQFQNHARLCAGAVSDTHNIFAVMENNGRVSWLQLKAARQGGICGGDRVHFLNEWKGDGGGCLRFVSGSAGERLVALDAKGNGVVVEFERE